MPAAPHVTPHKLQVLALASPYHRILLGILTDGITTNATCLSQEGKQ